MKTLYLVVFLVFVAFDMQLFLKRC